MKSKQQIKAESSAKAKSQYKSDALDELLEDNLFKKKKTPVTNDDFVELALHAKVDANEFLGGKP